MEQNLIESLGRGEKLLQKNVESDEKILVKLLGNFGQAFVITSKRLYVLKWGFVVGLTFGGKCNSFELSNITGIQIKHSIFTGVVEVITPGNQDRRNIGYWGQGNDDAIKSDNAVTFETRDLKFFQEAVNLGRNLIANVHNDGAKPHSDLDQLDKLAELREKGILTEEEFAAKKKQILGL